MRLPSSRIILIIILGIVLISAASVSGYLKWLKWQGGQIILPSKGVVSVPPPPISEISFVQLQEATGDKDPQEGNSGEIKIEIKKSATTVEEISWPKEYNLIEARITDLALSEGKFDNLTIWSIFYNGKDQPPKGIQTPLKSGQNYEDFIISGFWRAFTFHKEQSYLIEASFLKGGEKETPPKIYKGIFRFKF